MALSLKVAQASRDLFELHFVFWKRQTVDLASDVSD